MYAYASVPLLGYNLEDKGLVLLLYHPATRHSIKAGTPTLLLVSVSPAPQGVVDLTTIPFPP